MGGMCARVCPTETLCEEACVREAAEGKPVQIGLLQRYAVDAQMATGKTPFSRAAPTGKRVAIVGAGPAGLACAHALAVAGHEATIFDKREKSGGLNEYGIAAYKTPDDFAAREVAFILSIGGIDGEARRRARPRRDARAVAARLRRGVSRRRPRLDQQARTAGESELANVIDAVDYIAELRQAKDLARLPVGRRVVVIGGGMTAVDVAVQSKRLGAESVTIVYRRGLEQMKASGFERELAQTNGVLIRPWAQPDRDRRPRRDGERRAVRAHAPGGRQAGRRRRRLPHRGRRGVHRHRPEGRGGDGRGRGRRMRPRRPHRRRRRAAHQPARPYGRAAIAFPAGST